MTGSAQQRHYLALRRDGATMHSAAVEAEIVVAEARLIDNAVARGELEYPEIITAAPDAANPEEHAMPKFDTAVDETPEDFDPLVELAADTLRGDVRDSILDWFKSQPKSWAFMSEKEQRNFADAADRYAWTLVKQACKIIAAGERRTIVAKLVEYREKEGVEAKLKLASTGEVVAQLHEACGREVLLVATGFEEFDGQKADPAVDPDQRKMRGIGDEYDEAA